VKAMRSLCAHDRNTMPSWVRTSQPSSWNSLHCSQTEGRSVPRSLCAHDRNTTSSWVRTSQPSSWNSLHCNQTEGRWDLRSLCAHDCSTTPSWVRTSQPSSWNSLRRSRKAKKLLCGRSPRDQSNVKTPASRLGKCRTPPEPCYMLVRMSCPREQTGVLQRTGLDHGKWQSNHLECKLLCIQGVKAEWMGILSACDGSTTLSLAVTSLPASWSSQHHSRKSQKQGSLFEHGHSTTLSLAVTSLPASWSSQHRSRKAVQYVSL